MKALVFLIVTLIVLAPVHGAVVTRLTGKKFSSGSTVQLAKTEFSDRVSVKNGANITATQKVKVTVPLNISCVYNIKKQTYVIKKIRVHRGYFHISGWGDFEYCDVSLDYNYWDGSTSWYSSIGGEYATCYVAVKILLSVLGFQNANKLAEEFSALDGSGGYNDSCKALRRSAGDECHWDRDSNSITLVPYRNFSYTIYNNLVPEDTLINIEGTEIDMPGVACPQGIADQRTFTYIKNKLLEKLRSEHVYNANLEGNYISNLNNLITSLKIIEFNFKKILKDGRGYEEKKRLLVSQLGIYNWIYGSGSFSVDFKPEGSIVLNINYPVYNY